jgi:general secretion pathway protein F
MPVFEYKALTAKGRTTSGIIDADSAVSARRKLRDSGKFPTDIREVSEKNLSSQAKRLPRIQIFSRIKPSEIAMMTRQLATLLSAGFPLVNAIQALIPQARSHAFRKILSKIKGAIEEGSSFAEALKLYPEIFSGVYINMVRAGESSGTLDIVLERLADIGEKQQALTHRIRSALAYPVLMAIIGALVLFLLLAFIVPSITAIFEDMEQVLPAPTRFLIASSELLKTYWWGIAVFVIGSLAAFKTIRRTKRGTFWFDRFLLTGPVMGSLIRKLAVARFARTLASLLENGVPMLSALNIVKNITGNSLLSEIIQSAAKEVERGHDLGAVLASRRTFPGLATQMIQVGEQSGKLEVMLNKIADVYENEAETSIVGMTSLLEPLIILVMGVIVGFIVLSICLPIFEMNQLVR